MKISIRVKTKSKQEKVEPAHGRGKQLSEKDFTVFVKELPIEGRANDAVIKLLSGYFMVPKSNIKIISGHKSKNKIVEINSYAKN